MSAATVTIQSGIASHRGGRSNQEDAAKVSSFITPAGEHVLLAIIADGVGGRRGGERASELAVDVISSVFQQEFTASRQVIPSLIKAFRVANHRIYVESLSHSQWEGMGTTAVAVAIYRQNLYLAHVGDSRAYLVRGRRIRQLTIDHTWAEEALQSGRPYEEIKNHPNRGVIKRFLGINQHVDVDISYQSPGATERLLFDSEKQPLPLRSGDRIVLCTDGVSDVLSPRTLRKAAWKGDAGEAAETIVQRALVAQTQDNATAIVLDLPRKTKMPAFYSLLPGLLLLAILITAFGYLKNLSSTTRITPSLPSTPTALPHPISKPPSPSSFDLASPTTAASPIAPTGSTKRDQNAFNPDAAPLPSPGTFVAPFSTPVPTFTPTRPARRFATPSPTSRPTSESHPIQPPLTTTQQAPTATPLPSPVHTPIPTPPSAPTSTVTPTSIPDPTATPTATSTFTPAPTATPTPTAALTATPTPTATIIATPTPTPLPSLTPTSAVKTPTLEPPTPTPTPPR